MYEQRERDEIVRKRNLHFVLIDDVVLSPSPAVAGFGRRFARTNEAEEALFRMDVPKRA